jgi:hypothetical protein
MANIRVAQSDFATSSENLIMANYIALRKLQPSAIYILNFVTLLLRKSEKGPGNRGRATHTFRNERKAGAIVPILASAAHFVK